MGERAAAGRARLRRIGIGLAVAAIAAIAQVATGAAAAILASALSAAAVAPARVASAADSASATNSATAFDAPRLPHEAPGVDRVLALENERLALMPAVAAWKWQHHAPVTDPTRERSVIADAAQRAAPLGLDPAPIERLFALQVRLASAVESELQRQWREQGFKAAAPVPDLARDLRPRLDRLTVDLLRAICLAAPALARPDFESRYAADADRYLNAAGWSPSRRRALLDALGAIRTVKSTARSSASRCSRPDAAPARRS